MFPTDEQNDSEDVQMITAEDKKQITAEGKNSLHSFSGLCYNSL